VDLTNRVPDTIWCSPRPCGSHQSCPDTIWCSPHPCGSHAYSVSLLWFSTPSRGHCRKHRVLSLAWVRNATFCCVWEEGAIHGCVSVPHLMKQIKQHGMSRLGRAAVLVLAALMATGAAALAPSEYQLKAVFLFNFAQFVEWPPEAFDESTSSLNVCIAGSDPFGSELEAVMQGESVGGRPLVVERVTDIDATQRCHLVYVNQPEQQLRETLQKLKGKPVLTVGETQAFMEAGGMIRFNMDGKKIRLMINPKAADEAQLRLSSKLLRSSELVAMEAGNAR
jgi:hypothetical protein